MQRACTALSRSEKLHLFSPDGTFECLNRVLLLLHRGILVMIVGKFRSFLVSVQYAACVTSYPLCLTANGSFVCFVLSYLIVVVY